MAHSSKGQVGEAALDINAVLDLVVIPACLWVIRWVEGAAQRSVQLSMRGNSTCQLSDQHDWSTVRLATRNKIVKERK